MAISEFYKRLRGKVGSDLLLMPGVAAIVRDEAGRILLQQQHDDSWSLPAGAVDPGESPSEAVAREVLEETGFDVQATRVVAVVGGRDCRVVYPNGDEVEYFVTVFECSSSGQSRSFETDETKRIAFFAVEDMPALAFQYPAEIFSSGGPTYFAKPQR